LDTLPSSGTFPKPVWLLWMLGGWTVQDAVHWALDGFPLNGRGRGHRKQIE